MLNFLFAESNSTKNENNESTDEQQESEYDEKKNTLLYGLGEDILNLIGELQQDEDERFDNDLQKVFTETKIPAIREKLFAYFAKKENNCLKQEALIILENRYDYPKDTVSSAILYSRDLKISEASPHLRLILEEEDYDYMAMAISALGKIGSTEDAEFLMELFESEASDDEKQALIIKQNIAYALEELHDKTIWDFMAKTASNTEENSIIRGSMASALGKTGDEKAVPILCELFEDKDPILRTAAIKGLTGFSSKDASSILLQGFKDSYYKVRLQSIKSAQKEKRSEAIPYILYRAKKDPEVSIKYAAIEALSEFDDSNANAWLVNSFNNEKTNQMIRLKIAYFMLKNNFDEIYSSVMDISLKSLADDKKKKFAIEIGKIISKIKNDSTASIAEAYLSHKDAIIKSIGLDMFKKNRYPSLRDKISQIAENKKNGALSRRAKSLLENPNAHSDTTSKTEDNTQVDKPNQTEDNTENESKEELN